MSYTTSGYDAANPRLKRRNSGTTVLSSDRLLGESDRRRLIESQRDLWRNYSVAAWAIRKHLDYVANFTFQPLSADADFNKDLSHLMRWWSLGENCDISRRHSLSSIIRLAECRALLDGDVFLVKHRTGTLQGIESDRVRCEGQGIEEHADGTLTVHGIKLNRFGTPEKYKVYRKNRGSYIYERDLPANHVLHLGYFDSFDQVRGVSPLVSATASFHDVLEVTEYARLKAKVTQLFALAIYSEQPNYEGEPAATGGAYDVNFGSGPVKLELEPNDKADFLESRHPSTEFQSFITMSLQAALKSLDIPWSFYDESFTNFFGSRSALIQYQQSCRSKRERLVALLDRITSWIIATWVLDGLLTLPSGMDISDLSWEWIPSGVPWWNPEQEIAGDLAAVEAGLRTRSEIRRERYGDDWSDVVRRKAAEDDLMRSLGLAVNTGYTAPVVQDEIVKQEPVHEG